MRITSVPEPPGSGRSRAVALRAWPAACLLSLFSSLALPGQEALEIECRALGEGELEATLPVVATTRAGGLEGYVLAFGYDPRVLEVVDLAPAGAWLAAGRPDLVVPHGTVTHPLDRRSGLGSGVVALLVIMDLDRNDRRRVIPAAPDGKPQVIAELAVRLRSPDLRDVLPTSVEFVDRTFGFVDGPLLVNHLIIDGEDHFSGAVERDLELMPGCLLPRPRDEEPVFVRGDVDGSGSIDITDGIRVFLFLFLGGAEPVCFDGADANDDSSVDITDGIVILNFLFRGGVKPAAPGPRRCGFDRTADDLPDCNYPLGACP